MDREDGDWLGNVYDKQERKWHQIDALSFEQFDENDLWLYELGLHIDNDIYTYRNKKYLLLILYAHGVGLG